MNLSNKFIILFIKKEIPSSQQTVLLDFFKGLLGNNIVIKNIEKDIIICFDDDESFDFEEIANSLNSELFTNLILFEGSNYNDYPLEYIEEIRSVFSCVEVINSSYLNEKKLFLLLSKKENDIMKRNILKQYVDDFEMLHIVKVFLENNQNTSLAATKLYMHRNTLINKIDKFIKITGYDIKNFSDAFIIYHFLK